MISGFMMKFFFTLLFFLSGLLLPICSQSELARKVVFDLAADEMHGRGYVRDGYKKAADYMALQYEKLGAQKFGTSYFQDFSFSVNTFPDTVLVKADERELIPGVDFIVDPACPWIKKRYVVVHVPVGKWGSLPEETRSRNDVIYVFDAKGISDKDSLQLFASLVKSTLKYGPVIRLQDKLTWSVASELKDRALVDVLRDKWDTTTRTISLNIQSVFERKFAAQNVVGMIPGKSKKKFVLITAHLDHLGRMGSQAVFNGANDNASGNAMLLELMDYYSKNKPAYSMVFIAFAGEEAGLIGSKYFVEHPLLDLKKIRFLINLDLLGTGEEGITVVNGSLHKKEFALLRKINEEKKYLPQIKERGEAANSDHYFFSKAGVPAFFIYTMGGSKAYHDVNDRADALSFAGFDEVSSLIRDFIAELK